MRVKNKDILLRTGEKILLGNNQEHEIYYDGSNVQGVGTGSGTVTGAMLWEGPWQKGVSYQEQDVVRLNNDAFVCNENHTSSISNSPSSAPELLVTVNTSDIGNISEDLYSFPVPISITASAGRTGADVSGFIDAVGSNWRNIVATKVDTGETLYCEVEEWDTTAKRGALHVRYPLLTHNQDVEIRLKLDDSPNIEYTALYGEPIARNIWKNIFRGVYHFSNIPQDANGEVKDSARNNNGRARNMNSTNSSAAPFGLAYSFKGDNDWVEVSGGSVNNNLRDWSWDVNADPDEPFTLETVIYKRQNTFRFMTRGALDEWEFSIDGSGYLKIQCYDDVSGGEIQTYTTATTAASATDSWMYVAATYDGSALDSGLGLQINSREPSLTATTNGTYNGMLTNTSVFGKFGSVPAIYGDGMLSEARLSYGIRSLSWRNATYYGLMDNLNTVQYSNNESKWDLLARGNQSQENYKLMLLIYAESDGTTADPGPQYIPYDTEVYKDKDFDYSVSSGVITFNIDGTFEVQAETSTKNNDSNNRTDSQAWIERDTGDGDWYPFGKATTADRGYTRVLIYNRQSTQGRGSGTHSGILKDAQPGTRIRVGYERLTGSDSITSIAKSCRIKIFKIE